MATFRQVRNELKDIEAIADGYKTKIGHDLWLADGLQKDAIQNSWDARVDKRRGEGWECGLALENIAGKDFLCISDTGTTGLNGTKFTTKEELMVLLNENRKGEDLAYFLNSNWSAKSAEEGGIRGRGKTLFLAASQDKKIFFESLRNSDNSYVFGKIYLDVDKQIKFNVHYDSEAEELFRQFAAGNVPSLHKYGTRIFILNPDYMVAKAILSGEVLSFIGNSRWETFKKYQAKIFVKSPKGIEYANLPYWYEGNLKNVSGHTYPLEIIKAGTHYRIKQLVLRYAPGLDLPESIKGIAIQRNGMTIERIRSSDLVHEEGIDDVYGWVEMETKPLAEEMGKLCEGPEHFDFSWTTKPAKYLRAYIQIRIREFARDFKITSEQVKKNMAQRMAEEAAIKSLAPLFKELGLFGKNLGKKPRKQFHRKPNESLRLSTPDFEFPHESRRVDFGEEIKGAYVIPINDLQKTFRVLIRVFIVSDSGEANIIEEKEISLSNGNGPMVGNESKLISSKDFKRGGYTFRARMVSLDDTEELLQDGTKIEKGTILYDRINYKFFVDMDPPETGRLPFRFEPRGRDDKGYLIDWESDGDNGYVVFYNDLHPRINNLIGTDKELSEALKTYLIEQGALIAFQLKLEESLGDNGSDDADFEKLVKSRNLSAVWPLFLKKFSGFVWTLNS